MEYGGSVPWLFSIVSTEHESCIDSLFINGSPLAFSYHIFHSLPSSLLLLLLLIHLRRGALCSDSPTMSHFVLTPEQLAQWPEPNYVDPVERKWLLAVQISTYSVATFITFIRLFMRAHSWAGGLGLDDVSR